MAVEDLLLIVLAAGLVLFGGLFAVMREKNRKVRRECTMLKEQLKQSCRMEAAARMAGGAAHDFNNMLAGICGAAECLKKRLKGDEEHRYCDAILNGCEQASHLARQMTRLAARRAEKAAPVNLSACLKESLNLLGHGIGREMEIIGNFDAENLSAAINSEHLQSLILNLGFNSRDALGGRGRIEVGLRQVCLSEDDMRRNLIQAEPGEYAEISFADDGPGIDAENMAHIFEPFFTTKGGGMGTGLGLPEVYGIVLSAGGSLRVENRQKGVCFYVFLPLVAAAEVPAAAEPCCGRLSARILIADDDPLLRGVAEDILKTAGCEVRTTDSAEAAEKACGKDFKPDAVMLDVVLPSGGGKKVYETLRKKDRRLKVVFMSGSAPGEEIEKILEQDRYTAFLDKPCRAAQAVETLQILLAKA